MLEQAAVTRVTADGIVDPLELRSLVTMRLDEGDTSQGISGARLNIPELFSLGWRSATTTRNADSLSYSDISQSKSMTAAIVARQSTEKISTGDFPTNWVDSIDLEIDAGDGRKLDLNLSADFKASEVNNLFEYKITNSSNRTLSLNYSEHQKGSSELKRFVKKVENSEVTINSDVNRGTMQYSQLQTGKYQFEDNVSRLSISSDKTESGSIRIYERNDNQGDSPIYQDYRIFDRTEGSYSYLSFTDGTLLDFKYLINNDSSSTIKNFVDATKLSDRKPVITLINFVFETGGKIYSFDKATFTAPSADFWESLPLGYSNDKSISPTQISRAVTGEVFPLIDSVSVVQKAESQQSSLDVIVEIFGQVLYLKGLKEIKGDDSHTVEYNGTIFIWKDVESFSMPVVRNGDFTPEFDKEIAESFPAYAGIKYQTVVALVGTSAIDDLLLVVAGADGNFTG
jgi:hypothetical protein